MTVFSLLMEYANYKGDIVTSTMPIFDSLSDCNWWRYYLSSIFENFHGAHIKYTSCTEVPR